MNSEGSIKEFASKEAAVKAGYDMPLKPNEKEDMLRLSEKERVEKYQKFKEAQGKDRSFNKSSKSISKSKRKMIAKSKKKNRR